MDSKSINPGSLFTSLASGFSQGVVASGKSTLYVSGQVAWDAQKRLVGGASLEAQAERAFENLATVVKSVGGSLDNFVSVRIYIVDYQPGQAALIGSLFMKYFNGTVKPATTWIGVQALAHPDFLIEIEATAVLD